MPEESETNSVLVNAKVKELETSQKALESQPNLDDSNTSENIKEKTEEEESFDDYDDYEFMISRTFNIISPMLLVSW